MWSLIKAKLNVANFSTVIRKLKAEHMSANDIRITEAKAAEALVSAVKPTSGSKSPKDQAVLLLHSWVMCMTQLRIMEENRKRLVSLMEKGKA